MYCALYAIVVVCDCDAGPFQLKRSKTFRNRIFFTQLCMCVGKCFWSGILHGFFRFSWRVSCCGQVGNHSKLTLQNDNKAPERRLPENSEWNYARDGTRSEGLCVYAMRSSIIKDRDCVSVCDDPTHDNYNDKKRTIAM